MNDDHEVNLNELIITMLRAKPFLWDMRDRSYSDSNIRNNAWIEISSVVLFYAISLFALTAALDDDYDDSSDDTRNATDTNAQETYSTISARLNCSKLVVNHKGVKIEENLSDSIYKPTPAPITVKIPFEDNDFTLSDVTTEAYENFTEHPHGYEYQDYTVQINFTDISVLYDYIEFSPRTESTGSEKISKEVLESVKNVPLHNITIDKKSYSRTRPEIGNGSNLVPDSKQPPECSFAFDDSGDRYNWFQVISQSGGVPGEVNATRLTPNVTEVLEPCHRPVNNTSPPFGDLLYEYESIEYNKFYRRERAFMRFNGTPSEFVDIVGQLVWAPANQYRRFYRLSYRRDDTGFYVNVRKRHKCVFKKDPLSVDCYLVDDFHPCLSARPRIISPGLQASLVG